MTTPTTSGHSIHTYTVDGETIYTVVHHNGPERNDLNAMGEPIISLADLRAFVRELWQQGFYSEEDCGMLLSQIVDIETSDPSGLGYIGDYSAED